MGGYRRREGAVSVVNLRRPIVTSGDFVALCKSDVLFPNYFGMTCCYLRLSYKGHKVTNMLLNDTVCKHYTIQTNIDICIIKQGVIAVLSIFFSVNPYPGKWGVK